MSYGMRDIRMEARALRQRWPISDEVRSAIVQRMLKTIADPEASDRAVSVAVKALLAAEAQNQKDDHKKSELETISDRNYRFDAIAAELGLSQDFIESVAREAGIGARSLTAPRDEP